MSECDEQPEKQKVHHITSVEEFNRIFGSPYAEPPSAVDRLAAIVDDDAAERVREADERCLDHETRRKAREEAMVDAMMSPLAAKPLGIVRVQELPTPPDDGEPPIARVSIERGGS